MFSRVLRNARQRKHKDRPGRKACSSLTIQCCNKWWLSTGSTFTQWFFARVNPLLTDTRHLDKTDTWIWSVPFRIQRQTHTDSADLRGILLYITPDRVAIWKLQFLEKNLSTPRLERTTKSSYVSLRSLPGFKSRALLLSWKKITLTHCACTLAPGLHPYLFQITKI